MSGAPSSYRVEQVGAVPGLGATYRTVLGRTAQSVLARRTSAGLPQVALSAGPVTAEPAHLTAYQHLVGAPVDDTLPPGLVHVLAFPLAISLMARADFPFSPLGMVHVANHVTQRRPVRLGEALSVTAWAHDAREHRRGTTVELTVEAAAAGEAVWIGRATYLSKAPPPAGLARAPSAGERQAIEIPERPQALWNVTEADIHTYAQVSGDRNPIHTSWLGARAFGFPRRIAHGMYTAARALHAGPVPDAVTWHVEFGTPVLIPAKAAFAQVSEGGAGLAGVVSDAAENADAPNARGGRRMMVWEPRKRKLHLSATAFDAAT